MPILTNVTVTGDKSAHVARVLVDTGASGDQRIDRRARTGRN
jgi:hypothetical protein